MCLQRLPPSLATLLGRVSTRISMASTSNHGPPGNVGYNRTTNATSNVETRSWSLHPRRLTPAGVAGHEKGYRSLQTGSLEGPGGTGQLTEGMTRFEARRRNRLGSRVGQRPAVRTATATSGWRSAADDGCRSGRASSTIRKPDSLVRLVCSVNSHQSHDSPGTVLPTGRCPPDVAEHELPHFAATPSLMRRWGNQFHRGSRSGCAGRCSCWSSTTAGRPAPRPRSGGGPSEPHPEPAANGLRSTRAALRIPLLRRDGVIEPATHETPVGTVDLFPTVLSAAGCPRTVARKCPEPTSVTEAEGKWRRVSIRNGLFGEIYPNDATELGV